MQKIQLRPYQTTAVTQTLNQFVDFSQLMQAHNITAIKADAVLLEEYERLRAALIVMATGLGKTVVFSATELAIRKSIEEASNTGLNTLIIAHRDELLQQAADKYRMLCPGAVIGTVGGGRAEYGPPVTVASIATISRAKHIKQLKQFGYKFVIVDEAHHLAAAGYQKVLDALPEAFVMLVTATPDRLDGKPITKNKPIIKKSIIDAIQEGYLTPITPIAVRTELDLGKIKKTAGDYNAHELEEVIDNPRRNQRVLDAYQEHASGRQFLGFAVTVAHAEHLAQVFMLNGVHTAVVSGNTPSEVRKRILRDFEAGEITGIWNCGVLTEGYDNPAVSCVIMARPTQSRTLFIQCLGRGTRLAPGKRDCILLDITDNVFNHRLEPMDLAKATGVKQKDGEDTLAALDRLEEEKEKEEGEKQERKIRQKKREADQVLNLMTRFDWKKNEAGYWVIEVGTAKHRVALVPDKDNPEAWRVGAKLAPDFTFQWWCNSPQPLDWAQNLAEREALKLASDPAALRIVDRSQPWRLDPVTPEQLAKLDKWKIRYPKDDAGACSWTKGEASDAIGERIQQFKARAEAKRRAS